MLPNIVRTGNHPGRKRIYSFQESRFSTITKGRGCFRTITNFKLYVVGKQLCKRLRIWHLDKGKAAQKCNECTFKFYILEQCLKIILTSHKINKCLLNCPVHRCNDICYNPTWILIWFLLSKLLSFLIFFFLNFKFLFRVESVLEEHSFSVNTLYTCVKANVTKIPTVSSVVNKHRSTPL